MLETYSLQCKVEYIGNNHHTESTGMRHTTMFRSTTDRIYDGGPIIF